MFAMNSPSENPSEPVRYRFTLVHGTFAAETPWVSGKQSHSLRHYLAKELKTENVRFNDGFVWGKTGLISRWSYDQTNKARLKGESELRNYLANQADPLDESERHFIIAHSHGGNVAMYALKNQNLSQNVCGLICLATPFLYPRKRQLPVMLLWPTVVLLFYGLFGGDTVSGPLRQLGIAWMFWIIVGLVGLFTSTVLWVTAVRIWAGMTNNTGIDAQINKFSFTGVTTPILLVRSCGDEATGVLRTGHFLSWLSTVLLSKCQAYGGWFLLFAVATTFVSYLMRAEVEMAGVTETTNAFKDWILIAIGYFVMLMFTLVAPLIVLIVVARLYVGWDAFPLIGELEFMTEDSPPGHPARIETLLPVEDKSDPDESWLDRILAAASTLLNPGKSPTLAHSEVYAREQTAKVIAEWCRLSTKKRTPVKS
jgi:hypothetical protein